MNLLQKQGFFNSITLYIGIAIGFFNSIILFQRFLTLEEIGYFTLLINISVIYTQLSSLGFANVITKYYPYFKTEDKGHKGFPLFVILVCVVVFTIITLCFILAKELIFSFYEDKNSSSLASKYYYYIIPVSFFTLAYLLQETFSRTVFKSIIPAFLREVLIKIFTSIGILLIAIKWLNFNGFITFYLVANVVIFLIITWYNYRVKVFRINKITPEVYNNAKSMINYGLFSMIGGSAVAIIPSLGPITLKMISGEAMVGIYGTFFGIATVINLPAKALNTTSYQIIADAWKQNNLNKIAQIYHKTSLIQLLVGLLILTGLIINQRNILFLLHKPEYVHYFNILIVIGYGFLIDVTGGLNSAIISFSPHYKVVVRFLIITMLISCVLCFLLISSLGVIGAAWSYVFAMLFLNFGYWLFIKLKFKLQPFGKKHLLSLLIGVFVLIVGLSIPDLNNYYFDILIRSFIVTIVYVALTYYLNISEDINDLLNKVLKKKSY